MPGSALEWLVEKGLPEVFEHFFQPDSVYRKTRYLGFVQRVLLEAEITKDGRRPYSQTTIREASRARSGRSRKGRGGQK